MSDVAIRAQGLSKAYTISHQASGHHQYRTLREDLVSLAKAPFNRGNSASHKEIVWALKDISFEVKRGEVLGIIGRNGAGKSTLLKILSRITLPTEGHADVYGRVGSLLEVGTGFHPELTGRENVFLSGAVLGMSRAEVRRKFDKIVAFAEIEKFLDTPVKRYSSGMYMRLAFAVAAHLDPEILLVDEVLAVGDAAFQKKCLGKMSEVASEGRTVLFVSHNMGAIQNMCARVLMLDQGSLMANLPTQEGIQEYLRSLETLANRTLSSRNDHRGDQRVRYVDIWLEDIDGRRIDQAIAGQPLDICARYQGEIEHLNASFALTVYTIHDIKVFHCNTQYLSSTARDLPTTGVVVCQLPKVVLVPGQYHINLSLRYDGDMLADWVERAMTFDVISGDFFGTGKLPSSTSGNVLVEHDWVVREGDTVISLR